ncbi:MAG: 6-phosphofructokinase, partial [Pirellulales bacterium]
LARHWDGRIVGCPGTIDNDLLGTDRTIGFSTAVATAVDAIDKLRDTATTHGRMFLVEVMGRHSGYLALESALAGAAEGICVPETPTDVHQIVTHLCDLQRRDKSSIVMVVAEGDEAGRVDVLKTKLEQAGSPFEMRTVVLGHVQRGGSPTPDDRILATRLGDFAVRALIAGESLVMAGEIGRKLTLTPFEQSVAGHPPLPQELLDLIETMSI